MDQAQLVDRDIENGKLLLKALDDSGLPVVAALWFYHSEIKEWRFLVASSYYDREGPRSTYAWIQKVLRLVNSDRAIAPLMGISLESISVYSPESRLIKLLRGAIRTGKEITGIRFSRNTINNFFVEDAYIYRML